MTLNCGTEQEKGIAIGEVIALQFCKRRKIIYIFICIEEGQCIILYFYNRRTALYNSEEEKGIARGKACALLLCKRSEMNYNPAI
jgi:hypothetical protein